MRTMPAPKPAPTRAAVKKLVAKELVVKKPGVKAPPAKTALAKPPTQPRIVAESPAAYFAGTSGRAWRMSGKHAVAYVHTAALAGELLATEPRQVGQSAMAVYYDRKGRAFAWQLRFDSARWDDVIKRLG